MKEITLKLYSYKELSKEAQEKALAKWQEYIEDPFMQEHMGNLVMQELDGVGIKYEADTINTLYSLSYCQGDGLMFEGTLYYKGFTVKVKHRGHYYHKYTADVHVYDEDTCEDAPAIVCDEFLEIYRDICDTVERAGYDHIEYITSEEYFLEECEANDYTFESNGVMRNA